VSSVSFALHAGKTFGILGGNECGKTTLAQVILGNLTPETGSIHLFGEALAATVRTPRWLVLVRVLFILCAAVALLLAALKPPLLASLLRAGAWSPLLLLLLLEAAFQWQRWRGALGVGFGGGSSALTETGMAPDAMLARGVAYISSEHDAGQRLPAEATIEEVIGRDMPLPKEAREARRREVIAALAASGFQLMAESGTPVGTPSEYVVNGLTCGELSGGQKHLVYLLSVLASRPKLLICDDCLCGLDIDRQSSFVQLLQRLQLQFGMAVLFMTVDLTSFTLMAHEAAFMKHGRLIERGRATDLIDAPQRRDTQEYIRLSLENEERSRGKNLRNAFLQGESVFNL
jgi:ABC-type glutathione transport system ATPase component